MRARHFSGNSYCNVKTSRHITPSCPSTVDAPNLDGPFYPGNCVEVATPKPLKPLLGRAAISDNCGFHASRSVDDDYGTCYPEEGRRYCQYCRTYQPWKGTRR